MKSLPKKLGCLLGIAVLYVMFYLFGTLYAVGLLGAHLAYLTVVLLTGGEQDTPLSFEDFVDNDLCNEIYAHIEVFPHMVDELLTEAKE
jgi:hypothetical protein